MLKNCLYSAPLRFFSRFFSAESMHKGEGHNQYFLVSGEEDPHNYIVTPNDLNIETSNPSVSKLSVTPQNRQGICHGQNNSNKEECNESRKCMTKYGTVMSNRTAELYSNAQKRPSATDPGLNKTPKDVKLGIFSGVYVPTCLNVLSILMFLRFGFIIGQAGILGTMGMLIASYIINLVTTFSLSAIASNGTVRGGGAYYLISRSLGPEFGGSIGLIFYLGLVFNTGLNAVGLIDCIKLNFGTTSGNWAQILPESTWYLYLWASFVLLACTGICFAGSSLFARASNALLIILVVATLSIPFSAIFVSPYEEKKLGIEYTGLSWTTFVSNLKPKLTKGAAGSQLRGRETFQDLFGILFPATGGIFAGASMSGDLKNPSKSIPKGTLYGLGTTFFLYSIVIFAIASTVTRKSFTENANIIQDTNVSGLVVLAGEIASAIFSTLMGVIGSAKLLQALARDDILPGFSLFSKGSKKADEPTNAIIVTYVIAQMTMLCNLNQIASFITMTYLMTFLVMNLACFLLKISSAPNFRPSFHFFNWQTALFGTIISAIAMFFVDGISATACVSILISIFIIIHYNTPPKSWGDVSQSLIYHQVRKYLLRLKEEHVKFWRPQILLFINDPRRQYNLIQFCNSMKKGALYILGHVIVTDDFGGSVPEARKQQAAWSKYIDFSKIKAFVNISISNGIEWGARNIVLSAGLGGMRPNIAVLGFYNLEDLRDEQTPFEKFEIPQNKVELNLNAMKSNLKKRGKSRKNRENKMEYELPTDSCKREGMISISSYVTILEDLLLRFQINVAVAKGFRNLEFPGDKDHSKKYIDLWPIQMSAEIATGGVDKQNVLTTNFDTYTLILQLGAILNTVPAWKRDFKLRVLVFVEYESDVKEERGRVESLLENLRIKAEVVVFWLASGNCTSYEIIVNGSSPDLEAEKKIEESLKEQDWWDELQRMRGKRGPSSGTESLSEMVKIFKTGPDWPDSSFQQGPRGKSLKRFGALRKLLKKSNRDHILRDTNALGVGLGMSTHSLPEEVVTTYPNQMTINESSDYSSEDDSDEDLTRRMEIKGNDKLHDTESDDAPQSPKFSPSKRICRDTKIADPLKTSTVQDEIRPSEILSASVPLDDVNQALDRKCKIVEPERLTLPQLATPLEDKSSDKTNIKHPSREEFGNIIAKSKKNTQASSSRSGSNSLSGHASQPKFSSKPVPVFQVAKEDGPGPSIMFAENSSPPRNFPSNCSSGPSVSRDSTKIDNRPPLSQSESSYSTQNLPLSFNCLPRRAQHLILNELIKSNSKETVVMFTTLPSPVEGTCLSEEASEAYLKDLDIFCRDCPPVLMIHSNSMTVTMSL
ncbi:Vacuolar cation-chloride cotransporter 1 [Golovinomyces cichoracearum]|uniref:Vacuolar cation-chloride cotransporter 1 n=1 Tax=Golovinomyces cichoracearum TaxID=62708 RepID=A0A420J4N9_9PEZI|nr:Vacuolar cation-chloride cotransporter 1 [Golovinomyces cichoracearum]